MPVGVRTTNERGCRGYDPWAFLNEKPKVDKRKQALWRAYLDSTMEMRGALERGSITLEQYTEVTKPMLKEYTRRMAIETHFKGYSP